MVSRQQLENNYFNYLIGQSTETSVHCLWGLGVEAAKRTVATVLRVCCFMDRVAVALQIQLLANGFVFPLHPQNHWHVMHQTARPTCYFWETQSV